MAMSGHNDFGTELPEPVKPVNPGNHVRLIVPENSETALLDQVAREYHRFRPSNQDHLVASRVRSTEFVKLDDIPVTKIQFERTGRGRWAAQTQHRRALSLAWGSAS